MHPVLVLQGSLLKVPDHHGWLILPSLVVLVNDRAADVDDPGH